MQKLKKTKKKQKKTHLPLLPSPASPAWPSPAGLLLLCELEPTNDSHKRIYPC